MRLRWQDIDMKAGEVSVSSYPDARFRAADGEVKIYAWKPKTEAGVRSIPIPKEDVALIGRWRMRTDDSPYVFTPKPRLRVLEAAAAKGERVYFVPPGRPDHSLDRIQEVAAESLGIAFCPSGVIGDGWIRGTMKDFRKTFATHCVARNVKPKELQKYMGHEDIKITMDFYTAVAEDAKERLLGIWPKAQSSIA